MFQLLSHAGRFMSVEVDQLIPIGESGNEDQVSFDFKDGSIWHLGKKIALSFEDFVECHLRPIER